MGKQGPGYKRKIQKLPFNSVTKRCRRASYSHGSVGSIFKLCQQVAQCVDYHQKIKKNMFWILEHFKPSETKIFLVKIRSGLTPHNTEMGEVVKAFWEVRESRTARRWFVSPCKIISCVVKWLFCETFFTYPTPRFWALNMIKGKSLYLLSTVQIQYSFKALSSSHQNSKEALHDTCRSFYNLFGIQVHVQLSVTTGTYIYIPVRRTQTV